MSIQYEYEFTQFLEGTCGDNILSELIITQVRYAPREWYERPRLLESYVKDDYADYIGMDIQNQHITFIPWARREAARRDANDYAKDYISPYMSDLRQSMKPGRFVRAFLADASREQATDAVVESWANLFKAHCERNVVTVELVRGEKVAEWYSAKNDRIEGDMYSCIQGHDIAHYELYAANPESVGLLVATNSDGKMLGRALVWTLDDGSLYMDYPYTTRDHISSLLRKEGKERGFLSDYDDAKDRHVILQRTKFDHYPQTDYWYFMVDEGETGRLYQSPPDDCTHALDNRSGGRNPYRGGYYYRQEGA